MSASVRVLALAILSAVAIGCDDAPLPLADGGSAQDNCAVGYCGGTGVCKPQQPLGAPCLP